jgi:RHS repeat-associated protein
LQTWRLLVDPGGLASCFTVGYQDRFEAALHERSARRAEVAYNLRFPGQYYMAETGLNQNTFRDYDPAVGRYVESDPVGLRSGVNTYLYALGNPTKYIDRWGLQSVVPPDPPKPSATPVLPTTGGPFGPIPAYPDTSDPAKCNAECAAKAAEGASQGTKICAALPGGALTCSVGWNEWLSACQIHCATE